jgi:hypothetical protein
VVEIGLEHPCIAPLAWTVLPGDYGMPKTQETKDRRLAMPRALLRKHTRITKKGRVKLEKGWSDKRIAKRANAEVALVRRLRGDLHGRLRAEVVREPLIEK